MSPSRPVLMQYGPPAAPPSTRATAGKVLTVLASVVGPPAAAVAVLAACITWSGCFLDCSARPDHLRGGLLFVLAAGFVLAGPVLAATLVRRGVWVAGACAVPLVELLLLTAG